MERLGFFCGHVLSHDICCHPSSGIYIVPWINSGLNNLVSEIPRCAQHSSWVNACAIADSEPGGRQSLVAEGRRFTKAQMFIFYL